MSDWGIIGDGSWGGALARRLADAGHEVKLVGLQRSRRRWPTRIEHTTDGPAVVRANERLVLAVPVGAVESTLHSLAPHFQGDHRLATTSRGLTPIRHLRASETVLSATCVRQVAVIAGAADARSLDKKRPSAIVVGSAFTSWASELQEAITAPELRVYTSADTVGVEFANTLAGLIAVVVAIARAIGAGPATEATALTRGLAEMERLACGLGGHSGTVYGLAGLGVVTDLVFDSESFAHAIAAALVAGDRDAVAKYAGLVESAETLSARAKLHGLAAPMTEAMHGIFSGQVTIEAALTGLMRRASRAE